MHANPQAEIRGLDGRYVLFPKVVDAEDARGVWIKVERGEQESGAEQFRIMIPWGEVLAIVLGQEFSRAIRHEARNIGFTEETQPD